MFRIKYRLPALLLFSLCLSGCSQQGTAPSTAPEKQSESSQALFEERAAAASIEFRHDSGVNERYLFVEETAPGCAFFDFDNDGFLDIFLVQSGAVTPAAGYKRPPCALYRNNRDGTFANVTAGSGLDRDFGYAQGVAIADYDNDGDSDLLITAYDKNHLLRNEGKGKFRNVTAEMGLDKARGYATSAAFGDYDNDGRLDLYVAYYVKWTPETNRECRNNEGQLDYCSPLLYDPMPDRLYRNMGQQFVDVTQKSGIGKRAGRGLAVAFHDYNGDGQQDIFVANDLNPNLLWRNNGNGTFTESAVEAGVALGDQGRAMAGMGIAIADYDHSGREGYYITNFSERPNMLFRNLGDGVFEDATSIITPPNSHDKLLSFGCEFFDYDADGFPDVITNNGHVEAHPAQRPPGVDYKQPKQLLRNEGGKLLRVVEDAALLGQLNAPVLGRGLATGDYDNDGRLDILAANQGDAPQLFRNRVSNGNHWISFKLVGTKSNRDAIGARLRLRAGAIKQSSSVKGGSSYLSASDRRVYFGLGKTGRVDELTVIWPSGRKEVLKNLKADTFYTITEGKGITAQRAKT